MATQLHNSWMTRTALMQVGRAAAPSPTRFYVCLADNASLSRSTAAVEFFRWELPARYGYTRRPLAWATDGAYSNTNQRHELPMVSTSLTVAGGVLQFQKVFLIADGHSRTDEAFTAADVSVAGTTITIAGNLLQNGDSVLLRPDTVGTLPAPLVAHTEYRVVNKSGDSFGLATVGSTTAIDLTSAGAGALWLRYATGAIVFLDDASFTLLDGTPFEYEVNFAGMNGVYGPGV